MDTKKYEVLLHTIDKGSFIKTCEDMGYTQSGITHMMNSLENEIGFSLLQRSNKGVQLTPEGKQVLPTIRELVKLNDKLNQEFDLIKGLETGKVRIGSFVTVASVWLPRVIQTFQERYPGIQIELFEENSIWRLEEWLQEGFIDICFFSKQPYHNFEWIDLKKDPYLAVLPANHPFAKLNQVPVEAFVGESFLMFRSLDGPDRDISRYFERNGIPLKSKYSCSSDFSVVFMIEHNLGISMIPELILEKILHSQIINVVTKPLFPHVYRQLGLAVRSFQNISPAMERFIKCTKDVLLGEE
ncbi:LysR substrate-binding domain-containing protein [Clostridium aminobutyricum]|uniref:LysR family transcriptional regulator n=1 Tax=Clostridium aminobutyricum TaxID=33953 RepID=A0A939D6E8_CLOAM|nr:LysR substrate-binding domain-containing protein [Clostridium aminobutyricum]MBN7772082.1 LysR family transcriptional regulator [Clostridium aminobutyricum]